MCMVFIDGEKAFILKVSCVSLIAMMKKALAAVLVYCSALEIQSVG